MAPQLLDSQVLGQLLLALCCPLYPGTRMARPQAPAGNGSGPRPQVVGEGRGTYKLCRKGLISDIVYCKSSAPHLHFERHTLTLNAKPSLSAPHLDFQWKPALSVPVVIFQRQAFVPRAKVFVAPNLDCWSQILRCPSHLGCQRELLAQWEKPLA